MTSSEIWLRSILKELYVPEAHTLVLFNDSMSVKRLFNDSMSVKSLTANPVMHVEVDFNFIRDLMLEGKGSLP